MSYSTHYNNQQKTFGIFIVCAFHLILIWALANGLRIEINKIPIPFHATKVIEQQVVPIPLPAPAEPSLPTTHSIEQVMLFPKSIEIAVEPSATITYSAPATQPQKPATTRRKLDRASKPDYPAAATRLGEEGATGLNIFIAVDGSVAEVKLVSSSGSTRLDNAAIKHAQRNWHFSPCTEGGKAVACWFETKLIWRIER